ncbi:MAG: hypothetical protein JRD68_00970, partial [Deltaproteobacteria bacterium]|nr:hypothetical protein [Deltaproteobacteria bacterium]
MKDLPALAATGIGSVPFQNLAETLDRIARDCPVLPYWPQLIRVHKGADMTLQFALSLPSLTVNVEEQKVTVETEGREQALTDFYEHLLGEDLDYFALPLDSGEGFYTFLEKVAADPEYGPDFLKGHVTGPVTLGQTVRDADGRSLLDIPELKDTVVKGLGAMAAWQAAKIRATGRLPLIFLDEPGLTGFGSAFSTLSRDDVVQMLDETAETARSHGEVLVGVHICGNTDWEMIMSTSLDVINFDAFGYLDNFLLFPDEIAGFIQRGGYIAWGIGPTLNYSGSETPEGLAGRIESAWQKLAERGLDPALLRK